MASALAIALTARVMRSTNEPALSGQQREQHRGGRAAPTDARGRLCRVSDQNAQRVLP